MLNPKLKQEITDALYTNRTKVEIARTFRVSRSTVYNISADLEPGNVIADSPGKAVVEENKDELKTTLKLRAMKQEVSNTRKNYDLALKKIEDLQNSLTMWEQFDGIDDLIVPVTIDYKKNHKKHDAVPILVASDWHVDEVVEGSSIGFVNAYNPHVAEERIKNLFKYTVKILKICANDSDIDTLIIAALGDFMSAWLHDELIQTNSMTPMEVITFILDLWIGGLDHILASGVVKKIKFVGACGNHGRITKRIQFKDRHKTSYEWMLYNLLVRHYMDVGETRIKFQLPTGYFQWIDVFGMPLRLHHGDNIRYQGGIGGVHIPVRKAIAQWDKIKPAYLDVFGHWHGTEWSSKYVINGSVIGYSAYAENLKADFNKAEQCLFLMHGRFGKTAQFPIKLQD